MKRYKVMWFNDVHENFEEIVEANSRDEAAEIVFEANEYCMGISGVVDL